MQSWLITILEAVFAGAMLSILADFAKNRLGSHRPHVIASIPAVLLVFSIAELLVNWQGVLTAGTITIQPVTSLLSTLYTISRLSNLVILTILVVGLAITVYTSLTLSAEDNIGPFYALVMLLVGSSIGIISSGDLLTLFLFWEGLSIAAYGLVSFEKRDISFEAAMKYFFLAGSGALVYLFGVALVYSLVGSIQLSALPYVVTSGSALGLVGLLMILIGLGVEVALFPVHTWLADAYGAAPALTGALHGRVVNEVLLFAMLKVIQPLLPLASSSMMHALQDILLSIAILTMIVGNLGALGQTNLRRMLAFSSIAQMGYMLAALSTFTPLGLVAVVFHIWNHGLVKSNFFMLTGVGGRKEFEEADLGKLAGAGKKDKILGILYGASSFAMMGSPPFGTFWSEILIVQSLLFVGNTVFFWVAIVVLGNIALSIGYYYRVINTVAFTSSTSSSTSPAPRGRGETMPSVFLLTLSVISGLIPAFIIALLMLPSV